MSEFNPGELTSSGFKSIPDSFDDDHEELERPAVARRPGREGLPSSYRMRADEHYVDQLTSRRLDRRSEAPLPPPPAPDVIPELEALAPAPAAPRVKPDLLSHLSEAVAIIENTSALLAVEASPLTRRVSADLIRAQAWRASWMLQATRVVDQSHRVYPKSRQLGVLFAQIRERFAAECRLTGVGLRLHTSDWTTAVVVDEALIVAGVSGAVLATLALIGEAEGVTIRITAVASGGDLRTIEIAQDEVPVPADLTATFFDADFDARPGGWSASLAAATARAAAQQSGGDAVFVRGDRAGCSIRLNLNRPV